MKKIWNRWKKILFITETLVKFLENLYSVKKVETNKEVNIFWNFRRKLHHGKARELMEKIPRIFYGNDDEKLKNLHHYFVEILMRVLQNFCPWKFFRKMLIEVCRNFTDTTCFCIISQVDFKSPEFNFWHCVTNCFSYCAHTNWNIYRTLTNSSSNYWLAKYPDIVVEDSI